LVDRLMRKSEAREVLSVSAPTLDRAIERGDLPVVRVSPRSIRIAESALTLYIKARTEWRSA
jgi:excisionase family DNA binding protein